MWVFVSNQKRMDLPVPKFTFGAEDGQADDVPKFTFGKPKTKVKVGDGADEISELDSALDSDRSDLSQDSDSEYVPSGHEASKDAVILSDELSITASLEAS